MSATVPRLHIFHKWTRWERFSMEFISVPNRSMPTAQVRSVESWQKRHCIVCDLAQERKVKS